MLINNQFGMHLPKQRIQHSLEHNMMLVYWESIEQLYLNHNIRANKWKKWKKLTNFENSYQYSVKWISSKQSSDCKINRKRKFTPRCIVSQNARWFSFLVHKLRRILSETRSTSRLFVNIKTPIMICATNKRNNRTAYWNYIEKKRKGKKKQKMYKYNITFIFQIISIFRFHGQTYLLWRIHFEKEQRRRKQQTLPYQYNSIVYT